jgi:hypothetical protein
MKNTPITIPKVFAAFCSFIILLIFLLIAKFLQVLDTRCGVALGLLVPTSELSLSIADEL